MDLGAVPRHLALQCRIPGRVARLISELDDVDMTSNFKEGESCAWWLLFNLLGPFGDMSVVKAAQGSGIRKVEVVDQRIESYIIVQRICAHVYGK